MSASPVNTHSGTVTRPLQCLPLLSIHTALQWQGPHNVCLSCPHTQRYSGKASTMSASPVNTQHHIEKAPTMSASPVNTHSVTVTSHPQRLPLLSTHTAVQWQGLHNVCLSCQHTQHYSEKAPTMSASPVNTHSVTVTSHPQRLPLLSTHTAVQWQAQSETKLRDHLMTVHPVERLPDKRPP